MGRNAFRAAHAILFVLGVAGVIAACGSESSSQFGDGNPLGGDGGGASSGTFGSADGALGTGAGCKPQTCADLGIECGPSGDGCGGIIANCGTCAAGQRCGGLNAPSKCVNPTTVIGCTPKTCQDLGVECGPAGDGCGNTLQCGTCAANQQCGANGALSKCVALSIPGPDGGACVAKTCSDLLASSGVNCGP